MKHSKRRQFGIGLLAALAAGVLFLPQKAKLEDRGFRQMSQILPYISPGETHPKVESRLWQLALGNPATETPNENLLSYPFNPKFERPSVRIVLDTQGRPGSRQNLQNALLAQNAIVYLGGQIETSYGSLFQSVVPIEALPALADLPSVRFIRLPRFPVPTAGSVTAEAVAKTGADIWQSLSPYRSLGAKICVLDLGFKDYQKLLGSELPSTVTARSFRADGDIEAGQLHGTACAEVVHDMAPDAELFLVNFGTDVEFHNAVDWIINQGLDVISCSVGWHNMGAGNGTGPICEDVKKAVAKGIAWVNTAGNDGESHWEGTFYDPDGNNWHNFSGPIDVLEFSVSAGDLFGVFLNWDDWGTWDGTRYTGSSLNYDVLVWVMSNGGASWIFAGSENVQNGTQWPVEETGYITSPSDLRLGIAIGKKSAGRNANLEVFVSVLKNVGGYFVSQNPALSFSTPSGSLLVPADSADAIAVGDAGDDDVFRPSSGQGPTKDGRVKPDISAPSGASTATLGPKAFWGNSATTATVAGAIALLKGKTPYKPTQIWAILEKTAIDLGVAGKDNQFGAGRLNLKK